MGKLIVRRILAAAVGLGMLLLGPGSLSACALVSSKTAECATPKAPAHCEKMDMEKPAAATVGAQTESCCTTSEAPLPESRHEATPNPLQSELVAAGGPGNASMTSVEAGHGATPLDVSPPPLRSLLCTFLI